MNRHTLLGLAGGSLVLAGGIGYALSDRRNVTRADGDQRGVALVALTSDERAILTLAALAPSGHNTQPWFVKHLEPYHWIVGSDNQRWLPGVDPTQRETMLSIGAFLQTLDYAASSLGYTCQFVTLATSSQDADIVSVRLFRTGRTPGFDTRSITERRTVRANLLRDPLTPADRAWLTSEAPDRMRYIPNTTRECQQISEQTIEANRQQAYREAAQQELAHWIRFSSRDAVAHRDGLTTASMDIDGLPGWVLRNFYREADVLKPAFRDQAVETARTQVAQLAGWLLISSPDNTVPSLLETGRRLQRLFLGVRERGIGLHPMTQLLEETLPHSPIHYLTDGANPVQFILRLGYVRSYPDPVSLRRSVDSFVRP